MTQSELVEYLRTYGLAVDSAEQAFAEDPAKAIELIVGLSYQSPATIDERTLARVLEHRQVASRSVFTLLHNLAGDAAQRTVALDHFERLFGEAPAEAIDGLYYLCANTPELLDERFLRLLRAHFAADANQAFCALRYALQHRPELIDAATVEVGLPHIADAARMGFYFIRELVKARPEFVPQCTLALFICVLHGNAGWRKQEMLQYIMAISQGAAMRAGIEDALRAPIHTGDRHARVLMALVFRHRIRARRHEVIEGLLHAAQWPALWQFLLFLVDATAGDRIASADAEEFLVAAHRLHLLVTPYEYDRILVEPVNLETVAPAGFGDSFEFLNGDAELGLWHGRVQHLAARFSTGLVLPALHAFEQRVPSAERELESLRQQITDATDGERRGHLERRVAALRQRVAAWQTGTVSSKEQRDLRKRILDDLRHAAAAITTRAIEQSMLAAYGLALQGVLQRDVDLSRVEPAVLPAITYLRRVDRMPKSHAHLLRLIEDRIEGRPSDWLAQQPEVLSWAEQLRAAQPRLRLEHWRAPFTMTWDEAALRVTPARAELLRAENERDLAHVRQLLAQLSRETPPNAGYDALHAVWLELTELATADAAILAELRSDLERVRMRQHAVAASHRGPITLSVETDPFKILFMGEYGFASCLSMRGPNTWSAVSNAIDFDKTVVWAEDQDGNILARRLIVLTTAGLVCYRIYTNTAGLDLRLLFRRFLRRYAVRCGVPLARQPQAISIGPLLADHWYDDGAVLV